MCARVVVVQIDVRGLDGQLAAVRHGVARVDREVHEDLLDLPGIGLDVPEAADQEKRQLDVGAEEPTEHLLHPADAHVQGPAPSLRAPAAG